MIISGVGRLGRDAECRFTPSGMAVANLAVAFNFGKKDEQGNRESQWLDLSLWGKQAEVLTQYLTKGTQVSITADAPHIEHYTKQDGTQQSKLVANIINIELLGSGGAKEQQPQKAKPPSQPRMDVPYDDDIPF